jgi:hypothetical protein
MPNPSRKHGETVCCAGITAEGEWKRLYPIRFRQLRDRFARWDWVSFEYGPPKGDLRRESCRVYEDRIAVEHALPEKERASFLHRLIFPSTETAAAQGASLALVRPIQSKFLYRKKNPALIEAERQAFREALRQTSMLDEELEPYEPVPFSFYFAYEDAAGRHTQQCSDWETSATYWRLSRRYGEQAALNHLSKTYNEDYPRKGMVFALGTVKARPKQWLLLGVIRLDEVRQDSFVF